MRPGVEAREEWLARGAKLEEGALEARRAEALQTLKRGATRVARRVQAVRGDLAKIGEAESMAVRLPWLIAEAAKAPRGAKSLAVVDWSTGEALRFEVPLDPAKPARAQVEAMFQRAKRLKLGGKVAAERLAQAESILEALAQTEREVAGAEDAAGIAAALGRARSIAPKDVKLEAQVGAGGGATQKERRARAYRAFRARSGAAILVGRGAAHNDALTFQVGRPHDLWLHAKGRAGAHVIVPRGKDQSCPGDVLADAACLAAHFSEARDEAVVEVQYTPRRYLRKPRGSAPGLVVVDREKVIAVRIEPEVLKALLEKEEE